MCRACNIVIEDQGACYKYLEWLDKYHKVLSDMKSLESEVLKFEEKITDTDQKKIIGKFRRNIIRNRKDYAKSDFILNELN